MASLRVEGHELQFLHDGEQCFPAMLEAIASAEHEILLEMYWFDSDSVGQRFSAALSEKASAGVRVHVIYDSIGSLESDEDMFDAMRAAGCHVYEYNPIAPWRTRVNIGTINNRDHRKMLIVDGCVGFTGGINIAEAWLSTAQGGLGFRDDMIRIVGPVVRDMRALFFGTYHRLADHAEAADYADITNKPVRLSGDGQAPAITLLANEGFRERRRIRRTYLAEIRRAKSEIVIVNSYFIPDRHVRRALWDALRRGVHVRIVLPTESDVPAVRYATRHLYHWMLVRGIRIYEWPDTVLHSKTAVIDNEWCTVGTHNFDYRSWAYNLEVNLTVRDRDAAAQLLARIEQDIAASTPIQLSTWALRPPLERLFELFFYWLRRFL